MRLPKKIKIVRRANAIVEEEVEKEGLTYSLWQCFAILLKMHVWGDRSRDTRINNYLAFFFLAAFFRRISWFRAGKCK